VVARPVVVAPPVVPDALERLPAEPSAAKLPAWRRAPVAPEAPAKPLSVTELTLQLKGLLEPRFSRVLVRGEVSGFKGLNQRGHLYFALKDAGAAIDVKIWASTVRTVRFALKEGLSVTIEGQLNVYEPTGRYSLIVSRIEPEGIGALALAFEQLKQKLLAEGLFGERRVKPRLPLPLLPRRIGVVTSLSGAALRDFLKVLYRRHPRLEVLVCDARVQGEGAAAEVSRGVRWLGRQACDVIVVTRGGGSAEDLWAFNEEVLARAIFASTVPVVSAVGHEVDTTLADLVADVRAPTPSAAAELIAPVLLELEARLAQLKARLVRAAERRLLETRHQLQALGAGLGDPSARLARERVRLAEGTERLARVLNRQLRSERARLTGLAQRLSRARPQALLAERRTALGSLQRRLVAAQRKGLAQQRAQLARLEVGLSRRSPKGALALARQQQASTRARLERAMAAVLRRDADRAGLLAARLEAMSPLKVLGRGYAIATREADGRVVRRAGDVQPGDSLRLRVGADEQVRVTVEPG
jgi:exodeoxyribonuclease VII large subunit